MLALTQARGGIAFSAIPFHCAYTYTQYGTCQALSFAGGICARRCCRDLQSLPGITSMGRNSWTLPAPPRPPGQFVDILGPALAPDGTVGNDFLTAKTTASKN